MTAVVIRTPGLYPGISAADYHADIDSLSASGAKLLATRTPYEFWYAQNNPPVRKREFDLGHAAHREILGEGEELTIIDAANYNRKADREARDEAYAAGRVPLLVEQYERVQLMARRVHGHPLAGALLADGVAEMSGWWFDEDAGIWLRFRPDWMAQRGDVLYVADVKTTQDAAPAAFDRSAKRFGYHIQDPHYVEGAMKTTGAQQVRFVFIVVSVKPPHMVDVTYLQDHDVAEGARENRRARRIFARCQASGEWPEYPIGPRPMSLPYWPHHEETEDDD
ncbi:PD-(D/E)XK nuclease-like domain-containing protein [Nocardia acidivorans]|uniref:PD-(D/E)XK nuclease-like domain-containing protein n=1 Tax=Nocardia acidivorans TaxID=404580 RepID=UPI0008314896|nr:PD-(D/E)XK nuclease-like domain-containing protein [Nocardia acidivorans]